MDFIEKNKKDMLAKKVWAVVGVTPDQQKFGYKIYKILKDKGYEVYGINPRYDEVDGEKLYNNLTELPVKPDCVDMVVNPRVGKPIIDEAASLGIEYIWLQPGTFDEDTIEQVENKELKYVYYDCVLAELSK